jgi:hypothetical protein
MVAEAGHHDMADGNTYEAGFSNAGDKWGCVNFESNMIDPVVLS